MKSGALDGIVIADFSRVLAGPYATMLLGDLGARVIKIERPGIGDDTRGWGPPYLDDGMSTYFNGVNRNKESRCIDLSMPAGIEEARRTIAESDVVIENFKPGTMDRLGLGAEQLLQDYPRLIVCSINGFGSTLGAELPGYDLLVQAMGGLMSITGEDPEHPTKVGVALVDVITGLHATVGILAALRHRDVTGEGQVLEVSLMTSLLSALVNQASGYVGAGVVPQAMGNAHPSIAPYAVFQAQDQAIVLAVGNNGQFIALAEVLGAPELATDTRFIDNPSRVAHREQLTDVINSLLQRDTAAHWQQRLTRAGVPCGPINDVAQAFSFAESIGLNPIERTPSGQPVVAHPIRFSKTPATYRLDAPTLES